MSIRTAPVFCLLACTAGLSGAAQAQAIWQADWFASARPTLAWFWPEHVAPKPGGAVAFADDGDILLGARSGNEADHQWVRFGAAGELRWAFNVQGGDQAFVILPSADGGAFLALGQPSSESTDRVLRIGADGALAWSRHVATGWLAEAGPGRIATSGCTQLTLIEAHSGDVVWQRRFNPDHAPCSGGGVAAGPDGAVYATFDIQGPAPSGRRIVKVDPDGVERWNIQIWDPVTRPRLVGLAGTTLVLETGIDVRGISSETGSQLWGVPRSSGAVVISRDATPEPIILDAGSIRRIDAVSGALRWKQPGRPHTLFAQAFDGLVLASDWEQLAAYDAATGVTRWTLPNADLAKPVVNWIGFGGAGAGYLAGVATTHAGVAPAPLVRRIEVSTGTLQDSIPVPEVAQGILGSSIRDDANGVVSVGLAAANGHSEFQMRRVDASTGLQLWRIAEVLEDFESTRLPEPEGLEVASQGNAIAVTMTRTSLPHACAAGGGIAHLRLHDRTTGAERWQKFLTSVPGDGCVLVSAPAFTQNGDIVVATGAQVACAPGTQGYCRRESLYMLAAADGSVRWRIDRALAPEELPSQVYPGAFAVVGDDVLLREPDASSGTSLRRISGLDGSPVWSSTVFTPDGIGDGMLRVDANHLVVYSRWPGAPAWGKVRLDSGAVVWTTLTPSLPACTGGCESGGSLILPGGDHVEVGGRNHAPVIRRWHNDGSGAVDDWIASPALPALKSWISAARLDANGALRILLHKRHRVDSSVVSFLATFDLETAILHDQQALSSTTGRALVHSTFSIPLDLPAPDQLLADRHVGELASPTTSGAGLLETSVTAHGNIEVQAGLDGGVLMPGELAGFHVRATYVGDAPISNARLVARMPWNGGVIALKCATTHATDCVADTRSGDLQASFDLEPGGWVELTGQLRVLDAGDLATLSAFAHGPVGLGEQDTNDNFAQAVARQALFRSGFDATP